MANTKYIQLAEISSEKDLEHPIVKANYTPTSFKPDFLTALKEIQTQYSDRFILSELAKQRTSPELTRVVEKIFGEKSREEQISKEDLAQGLSNQLFLDLSETRDLNHKIRAAKREIRATKAKLAMTKDKLNQYGISLDSTLDLNLIRLEVINYRARDNFSFRIMFENNVYSTPRFNSDQQRLYSNTL